LCGQCSPDARSVASRLKTKSTFSQRCPDEVAEGFRLAGKPALHYSELIAAIQQVPGVKSSSTAERHFRIAKEARHISKNLVNQWQITR
jgi:hypothetical protein